MNGGGIEVDAIKLMKQFDKLPDKVARKASRKATQFGATPIVRAARDRAPDRTGLTRKAIGKKTKYYNDSKTSVTIIGVRRGFSGQNPDGSPHSPFNLAHLIEDGHIAQDGTFVPGTPFIKQATQVAGAQAIDRMHSKLASEIEKEARSL